MGSKEAGRRRVHNSKSKAKATKKPSRRRVPRALEAVDPAVLPPRVLQTLERLLQGDSEKQIAARLGLSRNTVHHYVKDLYRRFDVSSRGELMAMWVRRDETAANGGGGDGGVDGDGDGDGGPAATPVISARSSKPASWRHRAPSAARRADAS